IVVGEVDWVCRIELGKRVVERDRVAPEIDLRVSRTIMIELTCQTELVNQIARNLLNVADVGDAPIAELLLGRSTGAGHVGVYVGAANVEAGASAEIPAEIGAKLVHAVRLTLRVGTLNLR